MAWRFDGVLLPSGEDGGVLVGSGEPEPLPGRFALVGLVDAHCHLTVGFDETGPHLDGAGAGRRLDALARGGVSLVRDVGGDRTVTLPLSRHPVVAGRRCRRLGASWRPRAATSRGCTSRWRRWICLLPSRRRSQRARVGSDRRGLPGTGRDRPRPGTSFRNYAADDIAAAVQTAHRLGARVAAHTNTTVVADLVACGVDSVEHGLALTEGDLGQLGARGGAWTPTLASFAGIQRTADPALRAMLAAHAERLLVLLPAAVERGVTILTGTDVVGTVAEEIGLLHAYGLTVDQALRAATTAARATWALTTAPVTTW